MENILEQDRSATEPVLLQVEDLAIEEMVEANGGGWCVGSAGTFGCPSTAGSYGTLSSH
jgi:hypothetical protein